MRRVVWILILVCSGCGAHKSYDPAPSSSHEFSAKMANHPYGRFISIHNQKLVPQIKSYVDAAAAYNREFGKSCLIYDVRDRGHSASLARGSAKTKLEREVGKLIDYTESALGHLEKLRKHVEELAE